jgi:hypothetical protein
MRGYRHMKIWITMHSFMESLMAWREKEGLENFWTSWGFPIEELKKSELILKG